ncbi:MAG: hypothetical protein VYA34_13930, partial [Myxococcota bacterium]|nr:hypothetical protein [Myxococcota bacterium]
MRRLLAIMAILLASPSVANGGDGGDSSTALKTNYKDRIIKLDGELGAVELRLRTLEANAAANANLEGRSFEIELAEARKLYQGKDCEGLMLLSGVLTLPEYQGERGYTEAQFLYGEAMLLCGNFSSALKVYERLSSGRHRFVKRCLRRIVLIQTHFEDPSKLIRWYKLADDARALDREDKYEVAKTVVYLLGAPTGAEQAKLESFTQRILAELMEDSFQNPKVFYLKAVYLVQQQKLKDAYAIFEKLAQMEGNNPSLTLLSEHSAMNAARIATEFGDHTKARLFYAQVRETSPLFERALFELAYTFVALSADIQNLDERTLAMQNAIDVLDTLALSAIDENLAANSIFIKGLIYSDLGLEEQAAAVFNSLKNRYIPLRKEAIKNVGHSDAVKKLYDAIVVEEPTSHGMLSEDIRLWLNQNSLLKETRRVSSLMELTVKLVDDTSAQVEQLNELLGEREQGDFLPTLKRPLAATQDLQNKLVAILNEINDLEFSALEPFVKKETLDKLKELRAERQKLDSSFAKLPQSAEA